MEILLDNLKQLTITEAKIASYNKVVLTEVRDNGTSVIAILQYFNNDELVDTQTPTLWEGQSYIDIGQWTDTDVQDRIKQLI